jgi:hypothetical protein
MLAVYWEFSLRCVDVESMIIVLGYVSKGYIRGHVYESDEMFLPRVGYSGDL